MPRRSGWLLTLGALAGCAGQPRTPMPAPHDGVSEGQIVSPGTVRYELPLGEARMGGHPLVSPTPVYPSELLPLRLPPAELRARLIVDAQGRVVEVRLADDGDVHRRRFAAEVRAATSRWRFAPLVIDRWAADARGDSRTVGSGAEPFSLDYVFRFECRAGKPLVTVAATP